MKAKKALSRLLRWETMLVVLLIALWLVFDAKDASLQAAKLAKGRKATDIFNFAKMLNGMGPYLLYSFMALGMALLLGMGDIDISVGAIAALSASVMGSVYGPFKSVMSPGLALALSVAACVLTGAACGFLNGFLVTRFRELFPMIIALGTQLFFRG